MQRVERGVEWTVELSVKLMVKQAVEQRANLTAIEIRSPVEALDEAWLQHRQQTEHRF